MRRQPLCGLCVSLCWNRASISPFTTPKHIANRVRGGRGDLPGGGVASVGAPGEINAIGMGEAIIGPKRAAGPLFREDAIQPANFIAQPDAAALCEGVQALFNHTAILPGIGDDCAGGGDNAIMPKYAAKAHCDHIACLIIRVA